MDERLRAITGEVNTRLDEGFRRTNDTFARVMARLATIDEAQKKIDGLSRSVLGLNELLGDKRARGAFGELQLETLVRNALPPQVCRFQVTLGNGCRADCVLDLPEPTGRIAVDAKFPLENFRRLQSADLSEAEQARARTAFRADVRRHIDAIASKYIVPGETADCALLFLPAEAVFAQLHGAHEDLIHHAHQQRVWLTSPTTLMAVLATARAVLRDVETRRHIRVIEAELEALAQDFGRFDERMAALARHLDQASRDAQAAQTSSRKLSARFQRLEQVRVGDLDGDPVRPEAGEADAS